MSTPIGGDDFENHCWRHVVPPDVLKLYAHYARRTFVGPRPALLAIDLYELAYQGGDRPVPEVSVDYPSSCGSYAYAAIAPTQRLFAAALSKSGRNQSQTHIGTCRIEHQGGFEKLHCRKPGFKRRLRQTMRKARFRRHHCRGLYEIRQSLDPPVEWTSFYAEWAGRNGLSSRS